MTTPMTTSAESNSEGAAGRPQRYNARVVEIIAIHESLRIFRIQPDVGPIHFLPGQYIGLGLGNWERGAPDEVVSSSRRDQIIERAYSISCPILNESGRLVPPSEMEVLEFYVTLVSRAPAVPGKISLTPRLFHLQPGDPLWIGKQAKGTYTLRPCAPSDHLVFVATGTGEAPHNAMITELLAKRHPGPITNVVCVRQRRDLGYRKQHEQLERQFPNYRYMWLTTREPENLDSSHAAFVGKRHLQDVFQNWDSWIGGDRLLDPRTCHVYLCGNPAMIGTPRSLRHHPRVYPTPTGMVETLEQRGFRLDQPRIPGNIHIEKYW